jgi:superfamily II DNA or RNA helicase
MDRQTLQEMIDGTKSMSHLPAAVQRQLERLRDEIDYFDEDFGEELDEEVSRIQNLQMSLLETFPSSYRGERVNADFTIEVTQVLRDGTFIGTYTDKNETCRVFSAPSRDPKFGCSCRESMGQGKCVHVYLFVDQITDQMHYDDNVAFIDQIKNRKYDERELNLDEFKFDEISYFREHLEAMLPVPKVSSQPPRDYDELMPAEAHSVERLAWDFYFDDSNTQLEIRGVIQQRKKRGDGWTKGRTISLERLYRGEKQEIASPADTAIIRSIEAERSYYSNADFYLGPVESLQRLQDQPNVLFRGVPFTVSRFTPMVDYVPTATHSLFKLRGTVGGTFFLATDVCLIVISPDIQRIAFARTQADEAKAIQSLVEMLPVPIELEERLLKHASAFQHLIPMELPEKYALERQLDSPKPLLLLRSRKSGEIDFGYRVRDCEGGVHIPGEGRLARPVGNGKKKQRMLVRDHAREVDLVQSMAEQLLLPSNVMSGAVTDFGDALDLLDRVQSNEADYEVLWDKNSEQPIKVLGTLSANNVQVTVKRSRDWFQLSGECKIDGSSIGLEDLMENIGDTQISGEYVQLGKHGWAKISQELRAKFQKLRENVNRDRKTLKFDASSAVGIREFLESDIQTQVAKSWQDCMKRLDNAEAIKPVVPENLNAQLRDYQVEGFGWLRRLAEWGVGGILADDMGLGKTLQTLAVLLDRRDVGPTLVIAPTSVGFNWVREAERFTPDLTPHLYRETDRAEFLANVGPGDLVVCSYGLALRDAEKLSSVEWGTLILDEAQAVKNSRSKTSLAIRDIPAQWRVALTGTPVENHLGELWSLFSIVSPGVFGGWEQFRKRFATPIEKNDDEERRIALRDKLKPFVLRRTKSAVLTELPARTEMNVLVEMNAAERKMYDKVRMSAIGEIDAIAKLDDVKDQRFRVLALLTRLRQLSCSPKLVHEDWKDRSSKLQQLCETMLELKGEGHRVLVFSQFVKHLRLIREMLDEEKVTYEYLDGSTPAKARQESVDRFQNGDATAFLISLKAGGTGLNLTAADYVIHMDPWWNPAVEDQATDRAHRMGQTKPVMVYRLIAQNSIEEEILKLHDSKRDLVAGIMDGASASAKLSTDDLIELLKK